MVWIHFSKVWFQFVIDWTTFKFFVLDQSCSLKQVQIPFSKVWFQIVRNWTACFQAFQRDNFTDRCLRLDFWWLWLSVSGQPSVFAWINTAQRHSSTWRVMPCDINVSESHLNPCRDFLSQNLQTHNLSLFKLPWLLPVMSSTSSKDPGRLVAVPC